MKYEIEIHPRTEKPETSGWYLTLNTLGAANKMIYDSASDNWYDNYDAYYEKIPDNNILFWMEPPDITDIH